MRDYWVPSVNDHGGCGWWALAEFTDAFAIEADFAATIEEEVGRLIDQAALPATAVPKVATT